MPVPSPIYCVRNVWSAVGLAEFLEVKEFRLEGQHASAARHSSVHALLVRGSLPLGMLICILSMLYSAVRLPMSRRAQVSSSGVSQDVCAVCSQHAIACWQPQVTVLVVGVQ